MMLLRLLYAAAFFTTTLAAIDSATLVQIVTQTPPCAQKCSLGIMPSSGCPVTEMDSCLCKNNDLQKALATCILMNCTVAEQRVATSIRQKLICKGVVTESRSGDITTTFIILAILTYPIVVLRFISRWTIARKIWWDDWCIFVSTICLIPLTVLPFLNINEGFGRHFWDIRPERIVPLRKTYYAVQMLYYTILTLSKLSILFLYIRIFVDKTFRKVIVASMAILICRGVIYLFCIAFQCLPVSAIWTRAPARCVNLQAMIFSAAGLSIFEDFCIMLLPILELKKLALSFKRKVGLVFMFALGSFASITSIIRLRYIAKFGNSVDVTWDNVDVVIWSDIEIFTAVICASIITIRPLIAKLFAVATDTISNYLGITRVAETLPISNNSNQQPNHWSRPFSSKISPSSNSGHVKLPEPSTHGSVSITNKDEMETIPEEGETTIKVWITRDATIQRGSIHMDDITLSQGHLAPTFRGRNVVEVTPPLSPVDLEAVTSSPSIRGSSSSLNREGEK